MHQYVLVTEAEARDPQSARGSHYSVLSRDNISKSLVDRSELISFEFKGEILGYKFYRVKEHLGWSPEFLKDKNLDFILEESGVIDFVGNTYGHKLIEVDAVESARLISQAKRYRPAWTSARVG